MYIGNVMSDYETCGLVSERVNEKIFIPKGISYITTLLLTSLGKDF